MQRAWPIACLIVAAIAFVGGRYSASAPASRLPAKRAEDRVAVDGAGPVEPWRIHLRTDDQLTPGSTKAVNDLEALHKGRALVGTHAKQHARLFRLAREIRFLGERIQVEMLCMDKPDGHYGLIDIDAATGYIVAAEFGEYPF